MAIDVRLGELLVRYSDLRKQGQAVSVEEVCRENPDLVGQLKHLVEALDAKSRASDSGSNLHAPQANPAVTPTSSSSLGLGANPTPSSGSGSSIGLGSNPPPGPSPSSGSSLYERLREGPAASSGGMHKSSAELFFPAGAEPVPGYALMKRIGRGGFGEVWKATGPGGVPVAMKFIRIGEEAERVEVRSLEVMRVIRHANLLSLFGVFQTPEYLIVVMELADRTLMDRFKEAVKQGNQGIPFEELIEYMHDAARGIDFLNEPRHLLTGNEPVGIQHRDIKPHNLLLVGGSVKVADFGLAKLLEQNMTSNTGSMTPAYAAPEFFKGKTSTASDQYSLAVSYCHLRGGRLPFTGNPGEIMVGHVMQPPDLSLLPEEDRAAVLRALAKEPEERWPNCRAFIRALSMGARYVARESDRPKRKDGEPILVKIKKRLPQSVTSGGHYVGELRCLKGHKDTVSSVTFSPNGRQALSGGWDKTARLWNLRNGRERHCFATHTDEVTTIAFSPDGRFVVSGSLDATIRLWSVDDGRELREFEGRHDPVSNLAFSPDGTKLVSSGELIVLLWDVATGQPMRTFKGQTRRILRVGFSPDGRHVLAGGDDLVLAWELATGKELGRVEWRKQAVTTVAFSPDCKRGLTGCFEDSVVRLWDLVTGKELRRFHGHRESVWNVAFSPDGKRALSCSGRVNYQDQKLTAGGSDNTVRLWDIETGKELCKLEGHKSFITSVAFSPNGKYALSGGSDKTLRLWSLPR